MEDTFALLDMGRIRDRTMPGLRRGAMRTMTKTWTGEEEELVLGLRTGRTGETSSLDRKVQRNCHSQELYRKKAWELNPALVSRRNEWQTLCKAFLGLLAFFPRALGKKLDESKVTLGLRNKKQI